MDLIELQTSRLLLRQWRAEDRAPFAAMNADPRVMEHFPALLSSEESDARAASAERRIAERGHGLWALEERGSGRFIGFAGLADVPPGIDVPAGAGPALEIGWRLAAGAWGQGYATEAARAALATAFERLDLDLVVSFTALSNLRSQAVMRRIGLQALGRFTHPRIDPASPLAAHGLWGLRRNEYFETTRNSDG
ncbi:GNAT family N-acetyltransferase [Rivibacter subsaxonicus]|uniref:RimJ/RimL family protein N-acetyltransferase n=1 Tax=Rivibacter subsaxonicus TaxID=457575 RepID=A0A4V2FTH4_9BURK|nr:GNAT family N-acetyltransferase [Rivibacter subsaxonicus]RZT98195.1 RimJ/RimL family protein N-acetyltransferase [Rivibacter subsaxonicus]